MNILKKIIVSLLITAIGLAAFRLSFDAQLQLAIASGVEPGLAGLYPLVVDAAILFAVLLQIWMPTLPKHLAIYLWVAIAFWTLTSVLGNAFHVSALPASRVTVDTNLAIAVNTVPAITLFLIIHIATATAFRAPIETRVVGHTPVERATRTAAVPQAVRPDIPTPQDEEMLAMSEERSMTLQEIADEVKRSKSWVGVRVKAAREARDARLAAQQGATDVA